MMKQAKPNMPHKRRRGRRLALLTGLTGAVGAGVYAQRHRDELEAMATHSNMHCEPQT